MKKTILTYLTILTFFTISLQANNASYYFNVAEQEIKNKNFVRAVELYNKSMALLPIDDIKSRNLLKNQIATSYTGIGANKFKAKEYQDAIYYYKQALEQLDGLKNRVNLENIKFAKMQMAFIYFTMAQEAKNIDNSISYYQKSIFYLKEINPENQQIQYILERIGLLYTKKMEFKRAKEVLFDSLDRCRNELGESDEKRAIVYFDIAEVYNLEGEYAKALEFYKKAISIAKKTYTQNNNIAIANIYDKISATYLHLENYTEALTYTQKALKIKEKQLGKEHSTTALSYATKGFIYQQMGEYDKALEYENRALSILEKTYNQEYNLAQIYDNLSMVYSLKGDYTKALKLSQKSLKIKKKILGENHLSIALNYNNLGQIYMGKRDFSTALEKYKKAIAIFKKIFKKENQNMAIVYGNIGQTYGFLGESQKALEYQKKSIAISKKVLGKENISIAGGLGELGSLYFDGGDYDKSLDYYTQSLVMTKKILGDAHPSLGNIYNSIALVYNAKAEYKKALEYARKSLNIIKKISKNNPDISSVYNTLGVIYADMGDYNQSLPYALKSMEISEKIFGKNNVSTAKSYNNLGQLYRDMGKYNEALKYYKKALKIKEKLLKEGHSSTIATYNSLGALYVENGEFTKALKILNKSLKTAKKTLGDKHIFVSSTYSSLGTLYKDMGDYPKALNYYQKSLDIRLKILGKKHPYTARSYSNISVLYGEMKIYKKSLEYSKIALKIYKQAFKKDNSEIAGVYNNMAQAYFAMGEYEKAIEYYQKDLNINKKQLGEDHPDTAQGYDNIGGVYDAMVEYQEALKYHKLALSIYQKVFGVEHINTANIYNNIVESYQKMGDYKKALEFTKKSLSIRERVLGVEHIDTAQSYNNLSWLYQDIKKYKNAYIYAKKAFNSFNLSKNKIFTITDNREKLKYLQSTEMYLSGLISSSYLYDKKEYKQNFNIWLNYKRAIFEQENSLNIQYHSKKINPKRKKQIERLQISQRELATLLQKQTNPKRIKELEDKISKLEIALFSKSKDITYKDVSKYLKQDELYIDFVESTGGYFLFTLDNKADITFEKFDVNDSIAINRTIQATKKAIKNGNYNLSLAKKQYGKLYQLLFNHINLKNKTSLIISPDGLLNTIPFEALYDGKKYLIEKLNIRYIPSGKEFVKLYEKNINSTNNQVVVFANPDFGLNQQTQTNIALKGNTIEKLYEEGTSFRALKNQDEPNIIKKLYGKNAKLYLGKEATESNFFKIKSPKILHLSTHGFYLSDKTILNPMLKAGIVLSGANSSIKHKKGDGIITALELSGMDLSHTKLVVLSACETGVGELQESEGVAGLNKAFMKAGADYIIMSLWSVPEKSTGELMKKFYENLKKGKTYTQSLREAKLWMIENRNSHPYFWSGFVGSGRD